MKENEQTITSDDLERLIAEEIRETLARERENILQRVQDKLKVRANEQKTQ